MSNSSTGRPVQLASISKRDSDRSVADLKHNSRRAKRFIQPPVSGNRKAGNK